MARGIAHGGVSSFPFPKHLMKTQFSLTFFLLAAVFLPASSWGQFHPSKESLDGLYPGKAYSPHSQRSFPSQVFWGDTHLHTGYSMDAGLFGNTTGHDTAYQFARGEEVISASGQPVKLARPLDWLVLTDHSDGMGMIFDLKKGAPNVLRSDQGKRWSEALQKGGGGVRCRCLGPDHEFFPGHHGREPDRRLLTGCPGIPIRLGGDGESCGEV